MPHQVRLLADALTNILHQHSDSVVPTIAYQLAQNISQAGDPIARAVGEDPTAFAPRCHDQVDVVNPLRNASDSYKGYVEGPKVIIIHGIEDHNSGDDFRTSFLDTFSHAIELLETTFFSHKLVVLGRYTNQLQECFSTSLLPGKRPIQLHNWLGREREICRKEKEID